MDTQLHNLIVAAQDGDLDAFGAIVTRFQGMARASAYTLLDDAGLAEDVAQEAFIEAYQNLPKLRDIDAFPGWFRRIIFKQGDRLLRGKHLLTLPLESPLACAVSVNEHNPALLLEARENAELVQSAVASLPERERIVVLLFYGSGYTLKEMAAFLEAPLTTIKKRLHDARKRLQTRLMDRVQDTLREHQPIYADYFSQKVRILIAARLGDTATVQAMLTRDPTLVHASMKRGEYFSRPTQTLTIGDTPIYEAAAHNHSELVKLLLDYGADINAVTNAGETPLHGAVAAHHLWMVKLLLDNEADINASLATGQTPLRLAVIKGYRDIVALLLHRGAQVNIRGKTGLTPLHWATLKGQPDIVSLLLTHGANVSTQDDAGRTPLDWVMQRIAEGERCAEYREVMKVLCMYESDAPVLMMCATRKGEGRAREEARDAPKRRDTGGEGWMGDPCGCPACHLDGSSHEDEDAHKGPHPTSLSLVGFLETGKERRQIDLIR